VAARGNEEFFDEEAGKKSRIVADNAGLFEKIAKDEADFHFADFVVIEEDRFGTFGTVTAGELWGDGFAIGDNDVNEAAADVGLDGPKMIAESVVSGFAGLGHEVGDVDAGSFGAGDSVGNLGDEQIGDDAGVKRAGPHQDEIGLLDGFDGRGERTDTARVQLDFTNGNLTARNASFALHARAVGEGRN